MRALILALFPALLVACGDDTVALTETGDSSTAGTGTEPTSDPTTPTSDPTTPTTSPGTSVGSDSATATSTSATSTVTTDPTVSTVTTDVTASASDTTAETSTTTGDTSTTTGDTDTGTTGGVMGCGMDGPEIDANLVHEGVPQDCGAIEFIGTNASDSSGPVYTLDGCPCGANCLKPDPWSLTLDMPLEWLPGKLPACPRVVVERQKSKQGCELVGMAIWDSQEPADAPARYYAGSLTGPLAAAAGQLKVEEVVAEECVCDNCCGVPTRLDLKFSALGDSATVAEGQQGSVASNQFSYDIKNFQSHLTGICDDSPHVDWVMRRQ